VQGNSIVGAREGGRWVGSDAHDVSFSSRRRAAASVPHVACRCAAAARECHFSTTS